MMDARFDCAAGNIEKMPDGARDVKPKPIVNRVDGLAMIEGNVIPKRDASRIKGHFLTASRALMRSTKLTVTEKIIIVYLQDMLMEDHDRCWPGLDRIAEETGLSRRTTITVVNKLADAGVIIKDPGGGRKHSTTYYLTQDLFPCQLHPETLCNHDVCQDEHCPWMRINSADPAPFMLDPTENKQCEICTLSQINSADPAPFIPLNSADPAPEEKNNNSNEKERGGKRSCPPAAGDPEPHPPLSIEMPKAESGSGHSRVKTLFCQMYNKASGTPYIWQAQDGAILKSVLGMDITLDRIMEAINAMFKDHWLVDKGLASMKTFKSNINKYLTSPKPGASGPDSWTKTIKVHSLPQPGEEPLEWPWPRTGNKRADHDIPSKAWGRGMHEFSSDLVHHVRDWILNPDKRRGSWPLTLTGLWGNGKTTFVATLLSCWRDHMTPEMLGSQIRWDREHGVIAVENINSRSQFFTFQDFRKLSTIDTSNEERGWHGEPKVNLDLVESLSNVSFLILDDICSCPVDKAVREALHDVLRMREEKGLLTVVTTNRTLTEIGDELGGSVADRLTAGLVLEFVDQSLRDRANPAPTGLPQTRGQGCTMPNPDMDSEKANIPYVEPEIEKCSDISIADQVRAEAAMSSANCLPSNAQDELAAAVASLDVMLESSATQPVNATLGGINPPMPPWGSGEE